MFGWTCSADRAKAHKERKQVEQEVVGENQGADAKESQENEENGQDQQDE